MSASTPLSQLHGVGPSIMKRLKVLGITTTHDLMWHFPRQYEDRSLMTDIIDVEPDSKVTIHGTIEKIQSRQSWKRRINLTEATVTDTTGSIKAIWFNQPYVANTLKKGDTVQLSGQVKKTKYGTSLQSPVYEKVFEEKDTTHTGRIVPKYSLTKGVTQKQLRYFMKQALEIELPVEDYVPEEILQEYELFPLADALQHIHFPTSEQDFLQAKQRCDFDSLYIIQLYAQLLRQELQSQQASSIEFQERAIKHFVDELPFTLTNAQKKASWAILQDVEKQTPMNRLLIGDVGSGKTIVAAIAMLNAVLNGAQAALMAPTEILAKQHYQTLQEVFDTKNITIELLTGSTKNGPKQQQLEGCASDIVVGTHALIQESVTFNNLGLAIVDEQHRFGVEQRKALKYQSGDEKTAPHLLSMTATPIPRTLALALYGDLDLSIIDELPTGRKPVTTNLVPPNKREDAYGFIREHLDRGEQCFVVCPLIDPSDTLEVKAVTTEYEHLCNEVFPEYQLEILHGKIQPQEKDDIMQRMRNKEIDILVSTSVIEVGVDIPNATIIVIEGADRFGLAQLHQFRGRVGRSDTQSYCLLFSESDNEQTIKRLQVLTNTYDGFKLAEQDLQLRGAGEFFGKNQTGFSPLAMLAYQQPQLLNSARSAAKQTLAKDYISSTPLLKKKITEFTKSIHLE